MSKSKILNTVLMLLASATIASATTFSDVSESHWTYQAVIEMANKGIFKVYQTELLRVMKS